MRPKYDDLDEFAFGDSSAVRRLLREQRLEERRFASRKPHHTSPDDDEYFDEMDDDYEDLDEDYGDYNEDEFDGYSGRDTDH